MKHCPLKSKLHSPAMHYVNHVQSCHILTVFKFNFAFKLPALHSYLSSVRTLAARPPTRLAWRAAAIATCPRAPPTSLREDSPRYSSSCKLSSVCVEGRDDTVQTVTPKLWMDGDEVHEICMIEDKRYHGKMKDGMDWYWVTCHVLSNIYLHITPPRGGMSHVCLSFH